MNKRISAYIVILVIFLTLAVGSRIFSIHSPAIPKIVPPAPPVWLLTPRGAPVHVDKGVLGKKNREITGFYASQFQSRAVRGRLPLEANPLALTMLLHGFAKS